MKYFEKFQVKLNISFIEQSSQQLGKEEMKISKEIQIRC